MFGIILATCITAHDCNFEIVEMKNEWTTAEQCDFDADSTLKDLGIIVAKNQKAFCDELK